MQKLILFILIFFSFVFLCPQKASSQTSKGLLFSVHYDSLATYALPRNVNNRLLLLNSSLGVSIGGFYNKQLSSRFISSTKVLYQLKTFRDYFPNEPVLFHYVGGETNMEYLFNPDSNFGVFLGIGGAYRIPVNKRPYKDFKALDAYYNLGLRYHTNEIGIFLSLSPSITKVHELKLTPTTTFISKFRQLQLGVEIPIKSKAKNTNTK